MRGRGPSSCDQLNDFKVLVINLCCWLTPALTQVRQIRFTSDNKSSYYKHIRNPIQEFVIYTYLKCGNF